MVREDENPRRAVPRTPAWQAGGMDIGDPSEDEEEGPPLVMERLRRFGWLAVVLVPLLVITLAQTFMSTEWALIVFVGGLVAITAWMQREADD